MRRIDTSPAGRLPSGNTPLRTRMLDHGLIQGNALSHRQPKDNSLERRTMSPNKLNATKKPFISPKLTNDRSIGGNIRRAECVNHPDRQAEYRITVSGETLQYCEKCAAQLASQGFKVDKMLVSRRERISLGSNVITSKYDGHPRAAQITDFVRNLRDVNHCLRENSRSLMDIQNHYAVQIRQLEQFYNGVVCFVNYIRNEHVGLLKEQSRKYVQIGLIQYGNNEESMEEIGCIIHDIESTMESIVATISQDQFRQCLGEYNKNLEMYRHRLEEQNRTMGEVTNVKTEELETKLHQIKKNLSELLGIKEQGSSNNFSFEASQEKHHTGRMFGKENQGPFRNLFDGAESFPCPDDSPQFKVR